MLTVHLAPLGCRTDIGRRGKLPFGQPVHAVVLDDVQHVHVAPHDVCELAHPDREAVAVARDADAHELPVGGVRARRDRRHAAVHAVESVGLLEEVSRRLAAAPDPGGLRHAVRFDLQLPEGLDDRSGDGVVAAPRAEGGHGALVVAAGEAETVLHEARMVDSRLLDVAHGATPAGCWAAAGVPMSRCSASPSITWWQLIG